MRIYLLLIVLFVQNIGTGQYSPLFFYNQNQAEVYYQFDQSPQYNLSQDSNEDNIWIMNQLRSPFNYSYTATDHEDFVDIPELWSRADKIIKNSSDHRIYVSQDAASVKLLGERFSLSRGDLDCLKVYSESNQSFDIIKHDNHAKTTVLNSIISIASDTEFELPLIEEIRITDHKHGTLYLPAKIIDAIRLTITVSRAYDRSLLKGHPFGDELEQILKPERYRVFVNPEDDQILSMIKEDYNGLAESVLFRSDHGSRPKFDPSAEAQFTVYPTVSYGDVGMKFYRFNPATYRLKVYSILGTMMWSKSYYVDGDASFSADLSFLPKGNYQYSLIDENGYRILSRRLGIIKY